jgi:hypothetical protein
MKDWSPVAGSVVRTATGRHPLGIGFSYRASAGILRRPTQVEGEHA